MNAHLHSIRRDDYRQKIGSLPFSISVLRDLCNEILERASSLRLM